MRQHWILEGRESKSVDLLTWARWFETADRKVAHTIIGDAAVSTVFLGIDHGCGHGPSLLFETMIFGGKLDLEQERYETYEQAEDGHKKMVARVEAA